MRLMEAAALLENSHSKPMRSGKDFIFAFTSFVCPNMTKFCSVPTTLADLAALEQPSRGLLTSSQNSSSREGRSRSVGEKQPKNPQKRQRPTSLDHKVMVAPSPR